MRIMNKRSNVIVAMLLIALVSSLAFGQQGGAPSQQQTTKGAVIKGKAPVNKEVLKVKLPRAQEATLKNGLRVILLESHKVPTFNMQLVGPVPEFPYEIERRNDQYLARRVAPPTVELDLVPAPEAKDAD